MHFAFSDQQTEFGDTVRQVLAKECTTDDLRAAFAHPSAHTPRWDVLAELGVVGLTVPESHGGLGLGPVDLVLLLEEAGRVSLPEPLLDTTGLVAPLLADLERSAGSAAATLVAPWLEAIAGGRTAAAIGAVGPTTGPPVAIAGADGADLLVLFTSGDDDIPELHVVDADLVTVRSVPSLDPTRRLGIPHWSPTAETRVLSGPDAAAALRLTRDRAAVATAGRARRPGRPDDHRGRRLRPGAPPIRQAHRQLPGRQAPVGRSPGAAGVRPARGLRLGLVPRPGRAGSTTGDDGLIGNRSVTGGVHRQGLRLRRRHRGGPGVPPGTRGHRVHVGVRPPSLLEAGLGAGRGLGIGGRPPRPGAGLPGHQELSPGGRPADRATGGPRPTYGWAKA